MHGIGENDKQQGRRMAWHNLTEIKEDLSIDNCWLSTWDIKVKKFLMEVLKTQGGKTVTTIESAYSYLTASDKEELIIGKPFNERSYRPLNNAALLDICKRAIAQSKGAFLESCGTVNNRNRVFLSFALSEIKNFQVAGRTFEPYLNFGNSFDGSCPVWVNTSNICTVCNNTFSQNLKVEKGLIKLRIKHTKNSEAKIENMTEIIEAAIRTQEIFARELDKMESQKISPNDALAFISQYIAGNIIDAVSENESDRLISTRSQNTIERIHELFLNGAGNGGKNLADLFSAFTDFYTHESSGGDSVMKQYQASEFGIAGLKKQEVFDILVSKERTKTAIKSGIALMALQSA
jgi:hypothetical protein